jgi:hypothetical protein
MVRGNSRIVPGAKRPGAAPLLLGMTGAAFPVSLGGMGMGLRRVLMRF